MELFLILIGLTLFFGPWVLIFVLFAKVGGLRRDLDRLRHAPAYRPPAAEPVRAPSATPPEAEPASPEATEEPEPEGEEAPAEEEAGRPWERPPPPEFPEAAAEPERPERFAVPDVSVSAAADGGAAVGEIGAAEALERSLASRWLVWLGAIAISLAGIFLTAYAIEQGLLGPAVRTALGVALGLALGFGGEWLRRRPFQRAIATIEPDYVPPALSAAGVFVTYASLYVGYAFYDLYPPLAAFVMLAAAGLVAVALSLLQGWFVALLGLVGSFLTPALIPSEAPSALALFSYLLAVLAASCAVVRYRGWWLLGHAALALATLWCAIWLLTSFRDGETLIVGIYALAVGALFQAIRHGFEPTSTPLEFPQPGSREPLMSPPELLGWTGLLAAGAMLFALVRVDDYTAAALVLIGVFALASLWLARREPVFDLAFAYAAALVCALFAAWHLPHLADPQALVGFGHPNLKAWQPVSDPPPAIFARSTVIFGALFALGGFLSLWRERRVSVFAGVSALAPVVLFTIAYWRTLNFDQDVRWAAVALVLAAIALAAAAVTTKQRDQADWHVATGLYAAAVTAFIGLGFAMTLEEAWLTVALALQLPALAWIDGRLRVAMLRRIAAIVAFVVLVRLVLNPAILDYGLAPGSLFNWILYGYGIPCLAFIAAGLVFAKSDAADPEGARSGDQRLLALLEAGALTFFVLLVSFQLRNLVSGSLDAPYDSFLEQSLQSLSWLAIAYVLMARRERFRLSAWPVLEIGARILFVVSAAQVLLVQLIINNPVSSYWVPVERRTFIGEWPIVDYLLLAYLAPAGFALAFHYLFRRRGWRWPSLAAGLSALLLILVYVTLEVRHWFQGATLQWRFVSDAESYAVSATWLVLALALLAAGIRGASRELRYASLAVLLVAVAKVFLGDMAGLGGLYRVAAFLGLGLSLVGIGYVYQRFVFAPAAGVAIADDMPAGGGGEGDGDGADADGAGDEGDDR